MAAGLIRMLQLSDPANNGKKRKSKSTRWLFKFSEKDWKENKMSYQYFLQPIRDIHLKSHLRYDSSNNGSLSTVNIFSIVGIIVLLLACINYINLTTAGAIKRAKETSVRKVVGATKPQLMRQFFLRNFYYLCNCCCVGCCNIQNNIACIFNMDRPTLSIFHLTPDKYFDHSWILSFLFLRLQEYILQQFYPLLILRFH